MTDPNVMDARIKELKELRRWHSENSTPQGNYIPGSLRKGPQVRQRIRELYWELFDNGIDPDEGESQ